MRGFLYSNQRDFSRSFAARDLGPPAKHPACRVAVGSVKLLANTVSLTSTLK